jgi:hypothetical protein
MNVNLIKNKFMILQKRIVSTIFSDTIIPFIHFQRCNEFFFFFLASFPAYLNILKQMKLNTSDLPCWEKRQA